MLKRDLNSELIKRLKDNEVFKNKLIPDIEKGNVFPAIRNNRIDFYFKGGKLFSFNKAGLSTHIKYATTPEDNVKNYVTEKEFSEKCNSFIKNFGKD